MSYPEQQWLELAQRLQSIAQAGLTYTENPYDIDRYEQLREIAIDLVKDHTGRDKEFIREVFASETGYPTPKVDIRAVIFRNEKLLMVQEKIDGKWSMPGGWADIGLSPSEIAVKEVQEEAGIIVAPVRLLAVLDKKKQDHPPDIFHAYKLFILCRELRGEPQHGMETLDARFFARNEIPPLSVERNTPRQIELMFEYLADPAKPVACD